ncbi:unnamed protein product [Peniophora sp. CBMAI 1063]|nr:unnamed protein product [Peniophora sp. CBMAI 1063]
MSQVYGDIPSVIDRPYSPDVESISSVFSTSSEESDHDMAEHPLSMSASAVSESECKIRRDDRFYFLDENVQLIVEKRVYNVPRTPLTQHSLFFRDLFACSPDARLPPGWSRHELVVLDQRTIFYVHAVTNAIEMNRPSITGPFSEAYPLYDVTCEEFGAFLSVLYPRNYARHDLTTAVQWTSVLKLATAWNCESIRELAIERLRPLLQDQPLETLATARLYNVEEWVCNALNSLVERDDALDDGEAGRLELPDVMCIMRLREQRAVVRTVAEMTADPYLIDAFEAKEAAKVAEREVAARVVAEEAAKVKAMQDWMVRKQCEESIAARKRYLEEEKRVRVERALLTTNEAWPAEETEDIEEEGMMKREKQAMVEPNQQVNAASESTDEEPFTKDNDNELRMPALVAPVQAESRTETGYIGKEAELAGGRDGPALERVDAQSGNQASLAVESCGHSPLQPNEVTIQQHAPNGIEPAVQQPPPVSTQTRSTGDSAKPPLVTPAPTQPTGTSSGTLAATRQTASPVSAPSSRPVVSASSYNDRTSSVRSQKSAPTTIDGRPNLWNRLSEAMIAAQRNTQMPVTSSSQQSAGRYRSSASSSVRPQKPGNTSDTNLSVTSAFKVDGGSSSSSSARAN